MEIKGTGSGYLRIYTEEGGKAISEIKIVPAAAWTSFEGQLPALSGKRALYFRYEGTGAMDFNTFTLH